MANDLYSFLTGPAPTNTQDQRALAEQLRRRRSFGELGTLTGDPTLQLFGQDLNRSADSYAQQLQQNRQKTVDDDQTRVYQDAQIKHQEAMEALTKRGQTLDHIYQMMMAQAALQKADKAGAPKIPRLRQGDIKDLQDSSQTIREFKELENYMDEGGVMGAKEVAGIPIPGSRPLANTIARFGFGKEEDKAAFAAKQKFDRLYTLAARNNLFGATLTPNEQRAWNDANPQTLQTDEQIKKALPVLRKAFEKRLRGKASGLIRENYDENAIAEYADLDGLGIDLSGGLQGHGPRQQTRIKVDNNGVPLGN
jgi:DNA-binding transcriptional MerR regulator